MQVIFSKSAQKALQHMDSSTKKRIRTAIHKIPSGDIKKLKSFSVAYRLRVGDYRVLFDITDHQISVSDILPRGEAYKK